MRKRKGVNKELSTVEKQKNELIPEEFPEGPFGSAFNKHEPIQSKSTEWLDDQKQMSPFNYPDSEQHQEVPRQWPQADALRNNDEEV